MNFVQMSRSLSCFLFMPWELGRASLTASVTDRCGPLNQ
jgi:hypothetical protein